MTVPGAVGSWPVVRELGSGGQGVVYLVRSPQRHAEIQKATERIDAALYRGGAIAQDRHAVVTNLVEGVAAYSRADAPDELGAGKVYKIPDGPEADKALGRLRVELDVLSKISSPHSLRVIH